METSMTQPIRPGKSSRIGVPLMILFFVTVPVCDLVVCENNRSTRCSHEKNLNCDSTSGISTKTKFSIYHHVWKRTSTTVFLFNCFLNQATSCCCPLSTKLLLNPEAKLSREIALACRGKRKEKMD